MASGTFKSSTVTYSGTNTYKRYFYVNWSQTNDKTNNKSTISWTLYGGAEDSLGSSYGIQCGPITVKINGTTVYNFTDRMRVTPGQKISSGTLTVSHDSDGTKSCAVSISAAIYYYEVNSTGSGTITLTPNPVYALTISAGTGSTVTVNRTSSPGGSTGAITAGSNKLYKNDKLKATFGAATNYKLDSHTVNGSSFTSGNTHTVSGDVAVAATATPQKSTMTATNATIGGVSTINVTRYNSSYTHTITYSFAGASGTVVSKSSSTSITWTVPASLHNQIPAAKSGTCTLTITTYNGNTSLGSNSVTIKLTADSSACSPTLSGTVEDTNAATVALTGDSSKIVLNASTAKCTLNTTMKYGASLASATINDTSVSVSSGSAAKSYIKASASSYEFYVKDSRGYTKTVTKNPTTINYIPLTLNGAVTRNTPTGSAIKISFKGNFFNGNFRSGVANTLLLRYRYKLSSAASWGSWVNVTGTPTISNGTYKITVSLSSGFDYQESYDFQLNARDGGTVSGTWTGLISVTKSIVLTQGLPVFDWGKSDFNFNVPVTLPAVTASDKGFTYQAGDNYHPTTISAYSMRGPTDTGADTQTLLIPNGAYLVIHYRMSTPTPTATGAQLLILGATTTSTPGILTLAGGSDIEADPDTATRYSNISAAYSDSDGMWKLTWKNRGLSYRRLIFLRTVSG